jgi:2-polyprenyl-3-methyl-5-hydroxy-6-metoxy-1,4-benzoquinol methylase
MTNNIPNPELTHDRLGADFDLLMNQYDISRRLEVLIDLFLKDVHLTGLSVLDAGCGTGRGAEQFAMRGARVTTVDLGMRLLQRTQERCASCHPAQASVLELPFADNTFDIVFSTEVIEHTPNPIASVHEMVRVLKPSGLLSLSTPNLLWQTPVRIASKLGLRPYDGLENFLSPRALRQALQNTNGQVMEHRGIHLLPFQIGFLHPFIRYIDRFGKSLLPLMINQAILYQKGA